MKLSGINSNIEIFFNILLACSTMGDLEEGMDIHQRVFENGFPYNVVVVNSLIGIYTKYERIHKA